MTSSSPWSEALCGLAGGVCQVLVGHPFDTIKVRLQTGQYGGVLECIRSSPIRSLYHGIGSPLLGIGLCNSVLFHSFATARANIFIKPSLLDVGLAGATAGLAMAMVNCPVELLKIKLQTNRGSVYKNLWGCAQSVIQASGPAGLFRGLGATLLRDMPSFFAYFVMYETVKASIGEDLGIVRPIVAGALSGITAWLPCYPQDVVKSVIQSSDRALTIRDAISIVYSRNGLRGFFAGFTLTMARAIPANSATFLAVEMVRGMLARGGGGATEPTTTTTTPSQTIMDQNI